MPSSRAKDEPKPRIIDQQSRVALPQDVLESLDAKRGDYVVFARKGGEVVVRKARWVVD